MSTYATWSAAVKRLLAALAALEPEATRIGAPAPTSNAWYELLRYKLQPQLELPPVLVVAVVGGTNIGKSAVFNHLAGEEASASSPLAAGTKHPVCLVPPGFEDPAVLGRLFEPFELTAWRSAADALRDSDANLLFWRVGRQVPPRLLLLDVPDVDSDAVVNWERARAVRDTADVLVAVLTQQKYNDAAVKQFFREAVAAQKPIIVLFNQCDLEGDRPYWPQWLATFAGETGTRPELVYVVPYDRAAAQALRLPFYEVGPQGLSSPDRAADLRQELAALHFDTIKIRTFRGAVARVLDPQDGVPAYLDAIRAAADGFATATAALSAREMARVAWPSLPPSTLVDEIRTWWDAGRASWSRQIHGFYRTLGRTVTWPVRAAWSNLLGPTPEALDAFYQQEREAIVLAVEKMLDELNRLAQVGNETLRPRLLRLLGGSARQALLLRVQAAHAALPAVDDDYRRFLWAELDAWRQSSPHAVGFLRSLDHVAAVARPAITISLAVSGWMLAGDLVGHVAVQAAQQTAGHLATEAVIAGGIAGGGEALVSTTSEGVRQAAGRLFLRIQARYAQQRAEWLAAWLERELLGDLLAELRGGAEVPHSAAFAAVTAALGELSGNAEKVVLSAKR
jgi:hypothetical protein